MKSLRICWTWVAYRKISKPVFDHQRIINEQTDIEIAFSNMRVYVCVCPLACLYVYIWTDLMSF